MTRFLNALIDNNKNTLHHQWYYSCFFRALKRKERRYHEWQVGVIMVSAVGTQVSPFEQALRDL